MSAQGCSDDCHWRHMYDGAMVSLADMADKQAGALHRVTDLRAGIVAAMKQHYPKEFTDAEKRLGRRMSSVDDEVLLFYLTGFLLLPLTRTAARQPAEQAQLEALRRALVATGHQLPPGFHLGEWAQVVSGAPAGGPGTPTAPPAPAHPAAEVSAAEAARTALADSRPAAPAADSPVDDDLAGLLFEAAPPPWLPPEDDYGRQPPPDMDDGSGAPPSPATDSAARTFGDDAGTLADLFAVDSGVGGDPITGVLEDLFDAGDTETVDSRPDPGAPEPDTGAAHPAGTTGEPPSEPETNAEVVEPRSASVAAPDRQTDPGIAPTPAVPGTDDPQPEYTPGTLPRLSDWLGVTPDPAPNTAANPPAGAGPRARAEGVESNAVAVVKRALAADTAPTAGEQAAAVQIETARAAARGSADDSSDGDPVAQAAAVGSRQAAAQILHGGGPPPSPDHPAAVEQPQLLPTGPGFAPSMKPEIVPSRPPTKSRRTPAARKPIRVSAHGPGAPQAASPDAESVDARILSLLLTGRPVFTSDLVDAVDPDSVATWELRCRALGPDSPVRPVAAKARHRARGNLLLPAESAVARAPHAFTDSLWATVVADRRMRGARMYELAVVLHRYGQQVQTLDIFDHHVAMRVVTERGRMGVVFTAESELPDGDTVRADISDTVQEMLAERHSLIVLLTGSGAHESHLKLAEAIRDEGTARKWTVTTPVVAARSWEYTSEHGTTAVSVIG